ncbi:MAG: universal stress protein [Acidobacteriota bacterium]|nr:universal stress protein [Acidobacteriota bacterium]
MAQLSRVLVPVEFSPRCRGAVQYAEALARHFGGEIVLLHVIPPPVAYFGSVDSASWYTSAEFERDIEAERTGELDAFPCAAGDGVTVRRLVRKGDPAQVIVEAAAAEHCDLIVLPTHGYGPFRRFLLGSVTAKILHDAACPVWTGPHMEVAPDPATFQVRRVLCALDLGLHTRQVLCWGARFAAEFGAALLSLHAIPFSTTRLGPVYFDPEWRLMLMRQARERMEFLHEDMAAPGEVVVDSGEIGAVVRDVALAREADLVVIGRGHRAHRRLPTHAYAIVRDAPCPVVSI